MDKTRIIVVEDNIVYCEYVCNLLAREGYHTVQAYYLSAAKKCLQQATDDDIVVSDLRLPDGNGIDLLRWMRKEDKMQPFIIMTDYAEVNTAVESMKLGSTDYIQKKLIEDKLVPLLRSIQNADGASSLEREPQSTATKGLPVRLLLLCRWWAICSFPVPFSPNIITLISVGATSLIRFIMIWNAEPSRENTGIRFCPIRRSF